MARIFYEKKGRRYVPVSEQFTGFPAEGVWIVATKGEPGHWSGYWIMRLGDPLPVLATAAFLRHQDKVASAISEVLEWPRRSPMDLAKAACRSVAEAELRNE